MTRALTRARAAWGDPLPDWVLVLATACDALSQAAVARRLDLQASTVSQILGNAYPASTEHVALRVRAALMSERVDCPEFGDMPLRDCHEHQDRARDGVRTSELRVRLARACPACRQWRHKSKPEQEG